MIDDNFWKRSASEVAEDLVGRVVLEYKGLGNIMTHGLILEVDAYNFPHDGRSEGLFAQDSGLIGRFGSRRGEISVITAHEEGGSGLVTLRKLKKGNEDISITEVYRLLEVDKKIGSYVGKDSGLYVSERPFDLKDHGLVVANEMPSQGPPNRVAYFTLKRG
jgi:hypothetical protein